MPKKLGPYKQRRNIQLRRTQKAATVSDLKTQEELDNDTISPIYSVHVLDQASVPERSAHMTKVYSIATELELRDSLSFVFLTQ